MISTAQIQRCLTVLRLEAREHPGFSLVEFLISSPMLVVISLAISGLLPSVQRFASDQTEVQAVLDNTRMVPDTVSHILRQAGNDPKNVGIQGIAIISPNRVRIQSDLRSFTGGNRGDPDGDTADAGEDVTIAYDSLAKSVEVTPDGGSAQATATNISEFSTKCFDAAGNATPNGASLRKITLSVTGARTLPDPQTGQVFSMHLTGDVQTATRK